MTNDTYETYETKLRIQKDVADDAYAVLRFIEKNHNPKIGVHLAVEGNYLRIVVNARNSSTGMAKVRAHEIWDAAKLTFWNVRADQIIEENLKGTGFTYGYIGNVWSKELGGDDRAWHIMGAHPGRPGTRDDQVGGTYSTEDRAKLAPIAVAIRAGYDAATVEHIVNKVFEKDIAAAKKEQV